MIRAHIIVKPKAEVMDPQGQAVREALENLGFENVGEVRVGRFLSVDLLTNDVPLAHATVEQMCQKLLANPVVEDYEIRLETREEVAP
ncbi:MAG: phosphoribosylformylglycinamidine synthase subunit PurS [Candidatus Hydrogenedentota bacterium]|jgi:phosphoribosylformylglycinamidine synthase|uniref:Phosphoribosylformylglycinamidine synthase subunit PurS n=1 Tax=Sumerlaea chitinivorans TaxID=2250252 RepID=A0A2Z4Y4J2_SUMC1|nr:Phosphoribosylformylglycinamidine synthase, PurS subunit [Candidatus Sumerlaea chitinivorans]RMH28943.1 MAG: phosphoribosylformylglycinamidine synthase subunit PurS [Candidatus Hydrogenedentota bacterium]